MPTSCQALVPGPADAEVKKANVIPALASQGLSEDPDRPVTHRMATAGTGDTRGVLGTIGWDRAQAQGTIEVFLEKSELRLKLKMDQTREGEKEES